MGNLISAILNYCRPHQKQNSILSKNTESEPLFIDPAIRKKAEKAMSEQGFVAGSRLNAPRGFETAYRRIMTGVIVDNAVKSSLYKALAEAPYDKTCEKFLLPGQWQWPEFDKWKSRFLQDGKFPYMWRQYPEICISDFDNFPLRTILEKTSAKALKELFQKLCIEIPPKAKKADLIELAEQKISLKTLCTTYPDFYNESKKVFEEHVNQGKCAILEHTINMLGYHLRDFYTNSRLKLDLIMGCPVEGKYAKGKGRITEDNIPPFFPGDRTGVVLIRQRR